jgi:hypothetical protein
MTRTEQAREIELQRLRLSRRIVIFGVLGATAGLVLLVLGIVREAPTLAVIGGVMAAMQIGVVVWGRLAVRPRHSPGLGRELELPTRENDA